MHTTMKTTLEIPELPISLIPREVAPPPAMRTHVSVNEETITVRETTQETTEQAEDVLVQRDESDTVISESTSVQIDLVDDDDAVVSSAAPSAEALNNTMSLKQLKDCCTELGLNTVGKKMELAQRIAAARVN